MNSYFIDWQQNYSKLGLKNPCFTKALTVQFWQLLKIRSFLAKIS